MSEKCVFCKSDGLDSGSVLYEGSSCIVIRNKHPLSKGHVLVISKAHYKDIYEMPEETVSEMLSLTKEFNGVMLSKLHAIGVKNVMNNGYAAGQRVFHAHMHVIPVYNDPEAYNTKKNGYWREGPSPELDKAYDEIKEAVKDIRV